VKNLCGCAALISIALLAPSHLSGQSGGDRLILFGDVVYFSSSEASRSASA